MADTGTPDMGALLAGLMEDERFGEIVAAVKKNMSESSPDTADESAADKGKSDTATASAPASGVPAISPELLSKVPEIIGMLSVGDGGKGSGKANERRCLLKALKPFLSEKRQSAVDTIVNITGITDILGL